MESILQPLDVHFIVKLLISLFIGGIIGAERESRGKDAGISTHSLVVAGSMLFTFLSLHIDPNQPARIAAQVITGIGFLGAGIIIHSKGKVSNLTTAASIWFSAALGMAIGFGWYAIALFSTLFALIVPLIPRLPNVRR